MITQQLRRGLAMALAVSACLIGLNGCGGEETKSGTVVKVDEAEQQKRQQNIQDMYKQQNVKKQERPLGKGQP